MWVSASEFDYGRDAGVGGQIGFEARYIVRLQDQTRAWKKRSGRKVVQGLCSVTVVSFSDGGWDTIELCPSCTDEIIEAMGGRVL